MDVDVENVAESSVAAAANAHDSDPTVSPSIKRTRTLFPQSDTIAPPHLHSSIHRCIQPKTFFLFVFLPQTSAGA